MNVRHIRFYFIVMATIGSAATAKSAGADVLPGIVSSVSPEIAVSTLGVGPEIDARVSGVPFGVRLGGNFLSLSHDFRSNSASYHGSVELSSGGVIADWYPFDAGFRLSFGLKINGNSGSVTAKPTSAATITVNHVPYSVTTADGIDGKVTFDSFAPYAGLGFGGEIFGGPTLAVDLGAMFQGTPKTALTAHGPTLLIDPTLPVNLLAEQQSLQSKIKDFSIYPVIQLSLGWRF